VLRLATLIEDADGAPYPHEVQVLAGRLKDALFEQMGLDGRREADHEAADEVVVAERLRLAASGKDRGGET
jgi:hypothetical protein